MNIDYFSKIERLLMSIGETYDIDSLGTKIELNRFEQLGFSSMNDLSHFLREASELGYIKSIASGRYLPTHKGWEKIQSLIENKVDSKKAFIAMWFSDDVNGAYEKGLYPALYKLGYDPLRIDKKEHNEKIDDHIIAEIRKSGLLVADFTGNRNGVYFEAGFAMGLGIPVIWTCHKDHIDEVHFDTRQYNHIVWESPEELNEKLTYRIEATIPNRPKPRSEDSSLRSE